jgi:hypothetical protein
MFHTSNKLHEDPSKPQTFRLTYIKLQQTNEPSKGNTFKILEKIASCLTQVLACAPGSAVKAALFLVTPSST